MTQGVHQRDTRGVILNDPIVTFQTSNAMQNDHLGGWRRIGQDVSPAWEEI